MGNKKVIFGVIYLVFMVFLITNISANIIISQPKSIYSLGDELSVEIKMDSIASGYMNLDLVCGKNSENIYHNVPDSQTFIVKRELIPIYIKDLYGNCRLYTEYGNLSYTSQQFEINKEIDILPEINQLNFDAGQTIKVKGIATKKNSQALNGFVEVILNENIKANELVKSGAFEVNFVTPENLRAGKYPLTIKVYDKDDQENILNFDQTTVDLVIGQKPGRFDIAIDKQLVDPGETIKIVPFLYDRAGDEMNLQVLLRINDSKGNKLYEGIVETSKEINFETRSNTAPGYTKIIIQKENITFEKSFEIKELAKISGEIKNNTLIITNIGNIPYGRIIEIKIGPETLTKEINLSVDESKSFELTAPDGQYDIQVKDELNTVLSSSGISLTGKVISVEEMGQKISDFFINYPIVWMFIFLVLVFSIYVLIIKSRKNKFYGNKFWKRNEWVSSSKKNVGVDLVRKKENQFNRNQNKQEKINLQGEIKNAEQVPVLQGQKSKVSVIALKIKEGKLEGITKENIEKALKYAYNLKAVSYNNNDYVIVIFSPLLTRSPKNEESAIKSAREIDNILKNHNKLFRDKINYGIGINNGDLINKIENNTLKFTSISKTIPLAKKIAAISNQEVLLSKDIHLATANSVKTDKNTNPGTDVESFKIKRVVNTEESRKFIEDFTRRN